MTDTPKPPEQSKPATIRRWHIALGIFLVIAILFAFGVYRWNWNGTATRIVTKVLPYPAAIVDGSVIRWSDYQEDVAILTRFYEKQKETAPSGSIFPTQDELEKRVLDRLVRDRLAEMRADSYGIKVSDADVRDAYETGFASGGADSPAYSRAAEEAAAAKTLDERYGLSPADYRERMLRPFLIRLKLSGLLAMDEEVNAGKKRKAEEAAASLRSGKDFRETVLAYSEDPNVSISFGDRGAVGPGLMPAEVDAALASAKNGDIIGPVHSLLGWHVLKVGTITGTGSTRKVTTQEIIVYPISIDDWLEVQAKNASIVIFVH